MDLLILILASVTGVLIIVCYLLITQNRKLMKQISVKDRQQKSLSSTYGKISEQWFPLMNGYPYDPQNFRFIGSPIDGIQFTDDKIIFCEFKVHKSQLNENQKKIRELVKNRKVEWSEFRFDI